ncbi:hypothetical protein [Endozoicomonas sp. SESOKO3]|nr:hypothetical protein [Endozoicomonas sp. SESOKO3]
MLVFDVLVINEKVNVLYAFARASIIIPEDVNYLVGTEFPCCFTMAFWYRRKPYEFRLTCVYRSILAVSARIMGIISGFKIEIPGDVFHVTT